MSAIATPEQLLVDYLPTMLAIRRQRDRRHIDAYYPESGPLRRAFYPKQMSYFAAGKDHRERLFLAANRVGKTEGVGAYELACHLTGEYPAWWAGRRFHKRVKVWAAGDTAKTVREIIQPKLLGEPGHVGTGMIPGDAILETTAKAGVPEAIDTVRVRHATGGVSTLVLKSYDQRRESFQGADMDVIWLDEEPPADVYTECLLRTMTTNGMVLLTFTPLQGLSEVVLQFLPDGDLEKPVKFVVFCTWDEVPHLSDEVKKELWSSIPSYQRDARSKGLPALGSGAIYPVPESDVVVPDFAVPPHWPRTYGMDVGWNRTAAIWSAHNRESDTVYLWSEYYRGEAEPSVHVQAIQARGAWIQGAIDPASRGRSQVDGRKLLQMYTDLGLRLSMAQNAVEAGIYKVWQRLSSGRLKVFASCPNWLSEFRLYRRDEKGKVVKERDHLMDATRYLEAEMVSIEKVQPAKPGESAPAYRNWGDRSGGGWMAVLPWLYVGPLAFCYYAINAGAGYLKHVC